MRYFHAIRFIIAQLALVLAIAPAMWGQAVTVGGYPAVSDGLSGTWLCSIPREHFGTTWVTTVVGDSACSIIGFNGHDAADGIPVAVEDITGGKLYPFIANHGGETIEGQLTFTWLPVMELTGDFGLEYAQGSVSIHSPDSTGKSEMLAKLKWRGNHTSQPERHKHNYHIKFLNEDGSKKDRSFFGLRKDNHWKLDGGQVDMLRVRNRVCADLWLDMSTPVWYHDEEPGAINGSRGRLVELFLNGEYQGIYNMTEPIDRKQLKLVKHDTINHEFHGQMWYVKYWCRTATMSAPAEWSNDSETWDGIEVEYPDFEEVHPTDWSTLVNATDLVRRIDKMDAWDSQADSLDHYFDMPVMEDYFIFITVLQALDNESKNMFYSNHDKAQHPRLVMTPWDLDFSTGASHSNVQAGPERPLDWISHMPMYGMFNLSRRHRAEVIDRYWQLRQTWLNTDSLVARFQRTIDELEQCGAAAREQERWSGDSDINGHVLDLGAEMRFVADWIVRRMAFLDSQVFARDMASRGDVNGDGELSLADVNSIIDSILTGTNPSSNADVNRDREINVADVNAVIDMILSPSGNAPAGADLEP